MHLEVSEKLFNPRELLEVKISKTRKFLSFISANILILIFFTIIWFPFLGECIRLEDVIATFIILAILLFVHFHVALFFIIFLIVFDGENYGLRYRFKNSVKYWYRFSHFLFIGKVSQINKDDVSNLNNRE